MTRVFRLTDSSEGYLAHLYRFVQPHVIVYSLPTWEARDVLDLLKANSFGKLEIVSIVGWLGIILVKGFFSFVVPIIAANSLPWMWQGCLRSNPSADRLACVTGLSILLPLSTWLFTTSQPQTAQRVWSTLKVLISIGLFSLLSQWLPPASISLGTWEYINQCIWNIEKEI